MHLIHNSKHYEAATLATSLSRFKIIVMNAQAHFWNIFSLIPPAYEMRPGSVPYVFNNIRAHNRCCIDGSPDIINFGSSKCQISKHTTGSTPNMLQNLWLAVRRLLLPTCPLSMMPSPMLIKWAGSGSIACSFLLGFGAVAMVKIHCVLCPGWLACCRKKHPEAFL